MSIIFTNGFSITPGAGGNTPPSGIAGHFLLLQYSPAINNGSITIPKHDASTWSNNFNDVNQNTGNAIYINTNDSYGNDNSAYLSQLIGNHTHLTFTQNSDYITFDCDATAWGTNGGYFNNIWHDPTFNGSPQNSISIIATSGTPFNDVDPITITITII